MKTDAELDAGIAALIVLDPRFAEILAFAGRPKLRYRAGGFEGLASIIVSQQLSVASAAAIWGRLSTAFKTFDHNAVRRARTATLVRVGLSAPKIRTLKAIATAIHQGDIDLDTLGSRPADEAHQLLTTLHGVGPWTADIYLLVCLGHADAWPAGDLALQEAARLAFALPARPSVKEMGPLAQPWQPWRGVAALMLWAYYRAAKGRDAAPVPST